VKTAVDSSVLLDVLGADPRFGKKSREALRAAYDGGRSWRAERREHVTAQLTVLLETR
jgi:hypothetical protein